MDDIRKAFISEIKPLFIDFLKADTIDDKKKQEIIKYYDDRILTLPDENVRSFFKMYESLKSNKDNPYSDLLMKSLMQSILFSYHLDEYVSDGDDWKQRARRTRRLENPCRLLMSPKLIRSLSRYENQLRQIEDREHLLLFDKEGKILYKEIGTHNHCGDIYAHHELIKTTYVSIHQHPLSHGGFSENDLKFSLNKDFPITRVITLDGIHEVIFGNDILMDYTEKRKIITYYNNILNDQKNSDEYKLFYQLIDCKGKLGKKRKQIIDKCEKYYNFIKLYEFEKSIGFHELDMKSSIELMRDTAREFGFIFTYYPI